MDARYLCIYLGPRVSRYSQIKNKIPDNSSDWRVLTRNKNNN